MTRHGFLTTMFCSLALLAALAVGGCATDPATDQVDDEIAGSCKPRCEKCHPGDVCTMLCTYPAHCQQTCLEVQMCILGYAWDATTCACVPGPSINREQASESDVPEAEVAASAR
jgi:hypothetical protein